MTPATPVPAPHWLRFARAMALVSVTVAGGATGIGCRAITAPLACEHCHCDVSSRSMSRLVGCDTIDHRECCMPVEGPLAPPELELA